MIEHLKRKSSSGMTFYDAAATTIRELIYPQ
jgi:hypothetical protein